LRTFALTGFDLPTALGFFAGNFASISFGAGALLLDEHALTDRQRALIKTK